METEKVPHKVRLAAEDVRKSLTCLVFVSSRTHSSHRSIFDVCSSLRVSFLRHMNPTFSERDFTRCGQRKVPRSYCSHIVTSQITNDESMRFVECSSDTCSFLLRGRNGSSIFCDSYSSTKSSDSEEFRKGRSLWLQGLQACRRRQTARELNQCGTFNGFSFK